MKETAGMIDEIDWDCYCGYEHDIVVGYFIFHSAKSLYEIIV